MSGYQVEGEIYHLQLRFHFFLSIMYIETTLVRRTSHLTSDQVVIVITFHPCTMKRANIRWIRVIFG